jgi:membrane-bound serine protease (ClpP class)
MGFRRLLAVFCAVLGLVSWAAGSGLDTGTRQQVQAPVVVPAERQADKVVAITIEGPIDATTALSVRRRIALAEKGGANAIVIEINSPGGELGAVLEITNAIKASAISNTVAWVNPDAYSGGAIVALACREIVSSSPASMGDAFIVTQTVVQGQNRMGLRGLTPDERTKLLPVLLADVTDSARRAGWDEYLVQAVCVDGIELWWVQDTRTGRKLAVNEAEFRMLFGRDPVRGKPALAGVTGGIRTGPPSESEPQTEEPEPESDDTIDRGAEQNASATEAPDQAAPADDADRGFVPASDSLRDVAQEFDSPERTDLRLERASQRPVLTPADAGYFQDLGYLTDGSSAIVMREDQLREYGFVNTIIRTDEELKAYFGATDLIRLDESWSEKFVRFMTSGTVRGVLIVVFLIALFLEMVSPGLTVPGAIAATALVLLLAPPALIGMAGWWEIVAIGVGLVLIALEAFVVPGFGVFGVLGIVSLFGGLLGTFVPAGGSLSSPATQQSLIEGAVVLLLSLVTAGVGIFLIGRQFDRLPILDRLVLKDRPADDSEDALQADLEMLRAAARDTPGLAVGMTGVTTTVLRPSGQAEFDGHLVDVVADLGIIDPGSPVRITRIEGIRIVVSLTREGTA